jgi:acetyl esterase/lipase
MHTPRWVRYRYGEHPAQYAELALPADDAGPPPGVLIMLHGGFWRARYDAELQHAVAGDLTDRGWVVWNVDYRGVGIDPRTGEQAGGGWPVTQLDVAAGVDLLAAVAAEHGLAEHGLAEHGLAELIDDPGRVVVAGHSAGGCLALWVAARHRLPDGAPGAAPLVRPGAVIAQAAVCDLVSGVAQDLGAGAVLDLMAAGPDDDAAAYALASPAALVPIGVPILLVTGADDDRVPAEQSRAFAASARAAGDDVRLVVVAGEGHFGHLDPAATSWQAARSWLDDRSARMLG